MYRKEVNEHSPLRILERSMHGGLGRGNLGVVMGRHGAGKTAVLVQIGLDDLMRDKQVLHVSLDHTIEHMLSWYDSLYDDLSAITSLEDKESVRANIGRNRVIHSFADHSFNAERLEKTLETYATALKFKPSAILLEGWSWDGPFATKAAELGALKSLAKRLDAELWMTAHTHREETGPHPTKVPPPCATFVDLIDVGVFLEPSGSHTTIRMLKDHGEAPVETTHLVLDANTLRLLEEDDSSRTVRAPAPSYTLLSGGAQGAESEFGATAEKFGLREVNFTFAGRTPERTVNLFELSDAELRQGSVSTAYVERQLHRKFPESPTFQKMLQTIWHQVVTAGEVFVVGAILEDGTVKGGTGWAAELARHFKKELHVFDQEKKSWFTWVDGAWKSEDPPMIYRRRFAGTGTRFLTDDGREAIKSLFERSFGKTDR